MLPVEKIPHRILDKLHISELLMAEQEALMASLALHFFTLYELWEWFVQHMGHDCHIEVRTQLKVYAQYYF
jgi:hypothetical protein